MPSKGTTMPQFGRWAGAILLGTAIAASAPAKGIALTLDEVVSRAKQEGQARLGIAPRKEISGRPVATRMFEVFQKRYPFIKINYERVSGFGQREKIFSEMVGGVVNYDVLSLSTRQIDDGIKANIFQAVDWKGLKVDPESVHPGNFGVTYRMEPYGISYNTDMIKDAEGQKLTWEDCANPKWKGKVAVIDRPRHLEVLYQNNAWGREKTLAYARRLAANNPIVERSRDEAFTKLVKGAYPMLCGDRAQGVLFDNAMGLKNVGISFPEPVPIVHVTFMFVPRAAKSPNAGILWIAWALSEEGQRIHDETEFTGNPLMPSSVVYKRIKGKKIPGISWDFLARSDDILREILTAMGFPIVQ